MVSVEKFTNWRWTPKEGRANTMLFGIIAHMYKQEQAHKFASMCLDMFAFISEGIFKDLYMVTHACNTWEGEGAGIGRSTRLPRLYSEYDAS